jgi:hypothetical protein
MATFNFKKDPATGRYDFSSRALDAFSHAVPGDTPTFDVSHDLAREAEQELIRLGRERHDKVGGSYEQAMAETVKRNPELTRIVFARLRPANLKSDIYVGGAT